jgi:hypothetical protein
MRAGHRKVRKKKFVYTHTYTHTHTQTYAHTHHQIVKDEHSFIRPEAEAVDQGAALVPDQTRGVAVVLFCVVAM